MGEFHRPFAQTNVIGAILNGTLSLTLRLAGDFRLALATVLLSIVVPSVAQGPNTDFAAWPSGLLTLITASYYGAAVDGEQLETIDPTSSFRKLGLLDYFPHYARGHDEDYVHEIWIEPLVSCKMKSVERMGDRTTWQDNIQYSGHVARLRSTVCQPLKLRLQSWASDLVGSQERIQACAANWNQRHIPPATQMRHPDIDVSASVDIARGNTLASKFEAKLMELKPTTTEFSIICDGLSYYAKISSTLSAGHHAQNVQNHGLSEVRLQNVITLLGSVPYWFFDSEGLNNDVVRGLFFALGLRSYWSSKQMDPWRSPFGSKDETLDDFDTLVEGLIERASMWTVYWSPLDYGGPTRGIDLMHLIWGVWHFGSRSLACANPGILVIHSALSDLGGLHQCLGIRCTRIMPSSEDSLFDLITTLATDQSVELGSWAGNPPDVYRLQLLKETLVVVVVGFFVSLGSFGCGWQEVTLAHTHTEWIYPTLRHGPFTTVPVAYGASVRRSPHPVIMVAGIVASIAARITNTDIRGPLGFAPFRPPAVWTKALAITLATLQSLIYMRWYQKVSGAPRRWQSKRSILLSFIAGGILNVTCIISLLPLFQVRFPGDFERWIGEVLIWMVTLPFFVMFQDGPIGKREGGRRMLYLWQWLLAAAVSMI